MEWVTIALAIAKEVISDAPAFLQVIGIIKNGVEEGRAPTADEWKVLDSIADRNNTTIAEIAADHGIKVPAAS